MEERKAGCKTKKEKIKVWKEEAEELSKHEESILVCRVTPRKPFLNRIYLLHYGQKPNSTKPTGGKGLKPLVTMATCLGPGEGRLLP